MFWCGSKVQLLFSRGASLRGIEFKILQECDDALETAVLKAAEENCVKFLQVRIAKYTIVYIDLKIATVIQFPLLIGTFATSVCPSKITASYFYS